MTFRQIAELLSLPPETHFNLPRGKKEQKEKKIFGNRITHLMLRIFGDRWTNELTEDQRRKAVNKWAAPGKREARIAEARTQWGLDETANLWADEKPPSDYCKFSLAALRKLNAGMEKGIHWTATAAEMRSLIAPRKPMDFVPPVMKVLPAITNPAVLRALTELRKVVNAIIRKYGKPHEIRIELARELRKNRKQRRDTHEANEKNHERRMIAAQKILDECRNYDPEGRDAERLVRERRDAVTKMLLHMECKGCCPYTGDCIPYDALFGGEVEVEHIIPASLMVDNDFNNLTLCYRRINAKKLNQTPWRAFGPHKDAEKWEQIIGRVKAFDNRSKLARFNLTSLEEVKAFASRRLNDTRYTSKLAGRLLMNLYADRDTQTSAPDDPQDEFRDRSGHQAIKVSSGTVTSLLRDAWKLYLGELIGEDAYKCPVKDQEHGAKKKPASSPGRKDRCDHRHHAVDAVVIALTSDKVIHEVNTLAGRLYEQYKRPLTYRDLRSVKSPGFIDENFRGLFRKMIVSRRPEHKLSGKLHEETFYGKIREYEKGKKDSPIRHKRVDVGKGLTDAHIEKIVDEGIKAAIIKFRDEGGFKKWSKDTLVWPTMLKSRNGNPVQIKKVRIKITPKKLITLGKRMSERQVKPGEVAYTSFFTLQTKSGTRWESDIVTLFDATQLIRALPKHDRSHEKISRSHRKFPDAIFRFSLMKGDLVRLIQNGQENIFVVRSFESDGRIWIAPINAAGKQQDMEETKTLDRIGFTKFLAMGPGEDKVPQPVFVDLLGQPHNIAVKA
uniref:HNH Cas9-type domain-containing protein n=1 Tax=mine drainage metagenome TaxID=410659 RepID=E6QP49_9ZZZZ